MKELMRSLLVIPSHQNYIKKISELNADAYVLDVEDAIAEKDKEAARKIAIQTLKKAKKHFFGLRINDLSSLNGLKDLQAVLEQNIKLHDSC
jgi:(S)-citramalyl-CoA lyase